MTKREMKEKLKEMCKESRDLYYASKGVKGNDDIITQKYLTKWIAYVDLYREFFGE